mgnify:CR=1 FL=1
MYPSDRLLRHLYTDGPALLLLFAAGCAAAGLR